MMAVRLYSEALKIRLRALKKMKNNEISDVEWDLNMGR